MLSEVIAKLVNSQYWSEIPMPQLKTQAKNVRVNKNKNFHYFSERNGELFYQSSDQLMDLSDTDENCVIIRTRDIETMLHEALF